jgi:iron(III) transport system ATP-binding protein
MISVRNLSKTYPATSSSAAFQAVDQVSFDVADGEFFTLVGPSGCGKTTTLRCIAGLEKPDAGTITLGSTVVLSDRVYVPADRRDVGMVFQSYAVWPHLTVFENAAFPLTVGRTKLRSAEVRERVMGTLALVGLEGVAERKPTQLSGGQQQRLSLARALVHQPKCLLFDEPLSNLDAKLRERMRAELRSIQRALGFTALYVTHDQIEALSLSDGIAVMHQGRIVQQGSPREIYFSPATRRIAEFIGASNLVPGTVVAGGTDEVTVRTSLGQLNSSGNRQRMGAGQEVFVSLRPEDVRFADAFTSGVNAFSATVTTVTFGGAATELHVHAGESAVPLRLQVSSRRTVTEGDTVMLGIRPQDCRVLPSDMDATWPPPLTGGP